MKVLNDKQCKKIDRTLADDTLNDDNKVKVYEDSWVQ